MIMEKSTKSIKKRIFFSHMAIVSICIILTLVVFILCFRLFIRRETRLQIVAANKILNQSITQNLKNNVRKNDTNDTEIMKNTLRAENALKQIQNYSTINYVLIDENKNIISLQQNKSQNNFIKNRLIPAINRNKFKNAKANNNTVLFSTILGNQYEIIVSPVKLKGETNSYLIVYCDLSKSNSLNNEVIVMLILILLVTALIASIISNNVSTRISRPVYKLIKYAKKVGERQYNTEFEKYDDDEIGELAETMHSMAQKLSAYDNTIKTFMQNASHELRTPLMSIQGYAEGIKYGVVDEEEKAVDIIIEESKRLSKLVDDLLYLSKIDAMQDDFKSENIIVEELIKSSIEKVNGIAVSDGKIIRFVNRNNENMSITGDKEKLIRAIINILGNCLRYCNKNIIVELSKIGEGINIEISDDGPGFDKDNIEHVFDRFYKGKNGNYGLGLAITKSIIERHEGSIVAKNKEEGGASFLIALIKP
jgi:two-component system sensor histidine kinase CssS